jgi:uncharacterized damage-inducible protein DinB
MNERDALLQTLSTAPTLLRGFMETVPDSVLDRQRGQGFWTIKEHLAHLTDVQPMLLLRLARFRDESHPDFQPHLPGDDAGQALPIDQPVSKLLESFENERQKQLQVIESLSDDVWSRTASHPEYTHYDATVLIRHVALHDHWHMYRMEELWLTRDQYLTELK